MTLCDPKSETRPQWKRFRDRKPSWGPHILVLYTSSIFFIFSFLFFFCQTWPHFVFFVGVYGFCLFVFTTGEVFIFTNLMCDVYFVEIIQINYKNNMIRKNMFLKLILMTVGFDCLENFLYPFFHFCKELLLNISYLSGA